MPTSYKVIRGIDYRGRRKEPGESVDDLNQSEVKDLLARGVIEKAPATKKKKKGED